MPTSLSSHCSTWNSSGGKLSPSAHPTPEVIKLIPQHRGGAGGDLMVFPPIGASFGSPQGYLGPDRWITALHLTAGGCIRPAAEENGGKPVGGPMVFPPRFGVNCSTWNNAHGKSAPYVQSKWDERRSAGLKLIFIGRKQDGPWCQLRWEKRAKRMALRLFPSTYAPITASTRLAAAAARSLRPNLGIKISSSARL